MKTIDTDRSSTKIQRKINVQKTSHTIFNSEKHIKRRIL